MIRRTTHLLLFCMAVSSLAGCVTQTTRTNALGNTVVVPNSSSKNDTLAQALLTDPDAIRLEDVSEALLDFYAQHKIFPARLADLSPPSGSNAPLSIVSAVSNQPYVYSPSGWKPSNGLDKRLMVFDPTATKSGQHWVILLTTISGNAVPQSLEVQQLSDKEFGLYFPGGN